MTDTDQSGLGRTILRALHPPITVDDPELRFRLRALRMIAQVTSATVVIPIALYILDIATKPSGTYLLALAAGGTVMMAVTLWLLRRSAHRAAMWVVPAGYLLPNLVLPMELTVELLYPVLLLMFYVIVLMPRWAAVTLHASHMGIVAATILISDKYTLLPTGGDVNTTHYFSTYLILYAVATIYAMNFTYHLNEVTRELNARGLELSRVNAGLTNELAIRMAELERQQEELSRRRQIDALATVAGGIAHDVNNLMAVIQVNNELLEAKLADAGLAEDGEPQRIMQRIQRAVRRGEALTQRMLGVVRQETVDMEPISPTELVENVVDLLRPTLPAHIRVITDGRLDQEVLEGDRAQLEQVVMNLLVNSIHAIGADPGEIRIMLREHGNQVQVGIEDTGSGVPAELHQRVFEPFFTTKPQGVGTGLGLAQVQRVVMEHDGSVELSSQEGVGTTITLSFPCSDPALRPDQQPLAPFAGVAGPMVTTEPPRLLLAEDEDDIAEVIIAALPKTQIARFRDAEAAVQAVKTTSRPFDVMLLDLTLPLGSGRAVFTAARDRWPTLPVVVTTGYVGSEDLQSILAEPHTAYLRKPFSLRELRGAVDRMLDPGASGPSPAADGPPKADQLN